MNDFASVPAEQLHQVTLDGISPESINYSFSYKNVTNKKLKKLIVNENNVFFACTQAKKPVFRFASGQRVHMVNPFEYAGNEVICLGRMDFLMRGIHLHGYLFQFV